MFDLILCVDDDPITLMLCKMVISKAEFAREIVTATDGEEAIKYFDELRLNHLGSDIGQYPKLIFLDLNMPVMNGWEFLDAFVAQGYHETFTETKVIVLSSTIDPTDIAKSRTYPMVHEFMSKPITREMLKDLTNIT